MPRGLEHLGVPGPDYITEQLSSCDDPEEWISRFQVGLNIVIKIQFNFRTFEAFLKEYHTKVRKNFMLSKCN